ncbi:MAG TPA: hypothetical protein VHM19_23200 [Polyangiales bacterium]|nr:hypothetical protein [Polyangiales bacterium]
MADNDESKAPGYIRSGPDTCDDALALAKANARGAMETIARIMAAKKPPRNAYAQIAAASRVLELSGLGSGDGISYDRLVKVLREELEPEQVRRIMRRFNGGQVIRASKNAMVPRQ